MYYGPWRVAASCSSTSGAPSLMGRRAAPSKRFAHRAKLGRRANSLRPSIHNWVPRHALRVWAGAASQNLGQRGVLTTDSKTPGVEL